MERRNLPKTHDEVMMEQVLGEFQKLLLSTPEENTEQPQPQEDPEEVSEYDMIDPEVAVAELIRVLRNLPWRQNLEDEDLSCVWDYFHLTMQIMEDLHREHSQARTNSRKKNNQAQGQARQRSHDQWEPLSDNRPTSLDYLFHCSMCCDVFSMLCEHFGSNLPSSTRESQCTRIVEIIELPNDSNELNESSTSEMESVEPGPAFNVEPQSAFNIEPQPAFNIEPQPAFNVEPQPAFNIEPQPAFNFEPQPAFNIAPPIQVRPQRRSMSQVPNLPSTSRQYHFGAPEPPRQFEGRVSTSPVPNLPSTSKANYFTVDEQAALTPGPSNHYKGPQMRAVSEPPLFSAESQAERERRRKLQRIKKEKSLFHRKGKK